jgi:hypothetical protein
MARCLPTVPQVIELQEWNPIPTTSNVPKKQKKIMSKYNASICEKKNDLTSNQPNIWHIIWIFYERSFSIFKATSHKIFLLDCKIQNLYW